MRQSVRACKNEILGCGRAFNQYGLGLAAGQRQHGGRRRPSREVQQAGRAEAGSVALGHPHGVAHGVLAQHIVQQKDPQLIRGGVAPAAGRSNLAAGFSQSVLAGG